MNLNCLFYSISGIYFELIFLTLVRNTFNLTIRTMNTKEHLHSFDKAL